VPILNSVSISFVLEWSNFFDINVVGLLCAEESQLSSEGWKMEGGDLLVELLWQLINFSHLVFIGISVFPQLDLGKSLVGERA